VLVFDLKLVLLLAIFVFAFFRFTWSLRQYSFGALLVAAAPPHTELQEESARNAFAQRAGRVMGLAAESFNDGLRAYYMAFAATAWFFSPWAMLVGTAGRGVDPVPAGVPLRGAGRAQRLTVPRASSRSHCARACTDGRVRALAASTSV
jgi:hypothetical protein